MNNIPPNLFNYKFFVKDYQFWFFTKFLSLAYTYVPYSTVWCVGPTTLMDLVRNTRHAFNIGLALEAQVYNEWAKLILAT